METETIRIDFEVYKALTIRRSSSQVSYNDVLRELLELGRTKSAAAPNGTRGAWTAKGVVFPAGTEFRARYKGQMYEARVQDGSLVYAGKKFATPSRAAMEIAKGQTDGWKFWECRRPGDTSWITIKSLRVD